MAIVAAILAGFVSLLALALVWVERKVAAHVQQRLGPMRVGPHGLLQTLADGLKLLSKENITPLEADRFVFHLAPLLCFAATFVALAFIPFAPDIQVVNFNVGLVFVLGIGSVGVLGILAAGWSSNNKWSLLGAMRAGAQIISYELSATIALLSILVFAGSLDFREIVDSQARRLVDLARARGRVRGLRDLRDRLHRRVQPHPLRPRRGGERADRRVPHRVHLDPLRDVLPRRVREHVRGLRDLGHGLSRRLDALPHRRAWRASTGSPT